MKPVSIYESDVELSDDEALFVSHYIMTLCDIRETATKMKMTVYMANKILKKDTIRQAIEARLGEVHMSANRLLSILCAQTESSVSDFLEETVEHYLDENGAPRSEVRLQLAPKAVHSKDPYKRVAIDEIDLRNGKIKLARPAAIQALSRIVKLITPDEKPAQADEILGDISDEELERRLKEAE